MSGEKNPIGSEANEYTYEDIQEIANFLLEKVTVKPKLGIICGSGLGCIGDLIKDEKKFSYEEIPKFPSSTAPGHAGKLVFGHISNVPVVCMQGRFHSFEGYPLWKCTMPVRLMKLMGVTHLIVSNAAGGINPKYKEGDIMLIKDHVNFLGFAGNHPQRGPNDERFGSRFYDMSKAYDRELIKETKKIAKEHGMEESIREGVYACVGGPNYETIAEIKLMKLMGIDAVGMSTVHEVLTAVHCGLICFGFSLITNVCVTDYDAEKQPNSEDVMDAAKRKEEDLKFLVRDLITHIGHALNK